MEQGIKLLFEFLRDIIYAPGSASLDREGLPPELHDLGEGLTYLLKLVMEQREFATALSRGDLSTTPPPSSNELAAPLKSLHASLKHLTWQTQQVASGDYSQQVDFMGEFSESFNLMISQLDARQKALEREIELSHEKTLALEQSNDLLASITSGIPQPIFVVAQQTDEMLYLNDAAKEIISINPALQSEMTRILNNSVILPESREISLMHDGDEMYYTVETYSLRWNDRDAKAALLIDISDDKKHVRELEYYAYQDTLTKLNNRHYGMQTLNGWVESGKTFSLCFIDLDNLKYINDTYGHSQGDKYILTVTGAIKGLAAGSVASRIGGDEFMLLIPDNDAEGTEQIIHAVRSRLMEIEIADDEDIRYSISYGIVQVNADNSLSASRLLGMADERMYEFKRRHKKMRTG